MKAYIFEHGRVNSDGLNPDQIREAEEKHGKLLKVVSGQHVINVVRRAGMKSFYELSANKKKLGRLNEGQN